MKLKTIIFIILFIIILFLMIYTQYEHFNVSAYNSSETINIVPSQINLETQKIKVLLQNAFIQNLDFDLTNFNKESFKELSFYEHFVFEESFKNFTINILQNILLTEFPNIQISSNHELKNIYWKDVDNTRHFIFDITIYSENYGFTRIFTVYLILNNINNYLFDDGSYISGLTLTESDLNIKFIKEKEIDNIELLPGKSLFNFYEIKNTLHLIDPFLTSGKDIQITQEMRKKFEENLIKKNETLEMYSFGSCFDPENNILFTDKNSNENRVKCESQDPLNTWDIVPFNNLECPFYKKNLNYPNSFGKLTNNSCELPLNMKPQGYRFYSNDSKNAPLCYNCKSNLIFPDTPSSLGTCCEKQLNKLDYPDLLSPDYAFANDQLLRNKYQNQFVENNLNTQ